MQISVILLKQHAHSDGRMNSYFKRQLSDYVKYHRDPTNCALHVFGIIFLFLASVLPLSLWPVNAAGVQINMAAVMALPVLMYWLLLDALIGMGILCAAALLLASAAIIVNHSSALGICLVSALLIAVGVALQIIGHRVFERRQPALLDNPSHLLIGPMFVMAKLYVALGLRRDLAGIIELVPAPGARI
jgi:uncharacterized membrane protein YGL010W